MNCLLSQDKIDYWFRRLADAKEIVYDTETSGLDKHRNFACGYVFTLGLGPEDTVYFPVRHAGGGNIPGCRIPKNTTDYSATDLHPIERRIAAIAASQDKHWVGHHLKFDMWIAARHDIARRLHQFQQITRCP